MDEENPDKSTTNETSTEDAEEIEVVSSESKETLSPPATTPPESFNPSATETPALQKQPTKKKFLTKKRLLIVAGVLVLFLAGALIWLLISKSSDDSTDEVTINEDGTYNLVDNTGIFLPRYDNTKAYMRYKSQNWYLVDSGIIVIDDNNQLVRYYTHANGIKTGFNTGLLEYKGKVWLSTQDGVQYLDESNDTFVTSYNRIANGKI